MTALAAPPRVERRVASLAARGIVKRFGPVLAVDHADFELAPGVHALLGENGAGKSTLVKILYGYVRPDEGEILLDGRPVELGSPADARRLGIGLVFQQFTLVPALTVAENVALFLPELPPVLHVGEISRRIRELSERYGLAVDPARRVFTLSVPEQQRVEILRVLVSGARILCFDEPTSALPAQEIDALLDVFRRLRDDGYSIVFITHKLREVLALADTVTVMRRGAVVATLPIADVDEDRLVELMFGGLPATVSRPAPTSPGEEVLRLEGDDELSVRAGEIVGIAGVAGNGQRELCDAVAGLTSVTGRRILLGEDATRWSVRRIRDAGVAFVPENALSQELLWNMTLAENVALGSPKRFSGRGGLSVDWRAVRETFEATARELGLQLPDADVRAGTLSGGNAQRFALARELAREPRLLVVLYPTKGLDVPTAATVQRLLLRARERGAGVLLVSQDLAELRALSDRILVMRAGRIVADVEPAEADDYELGRVMTG